MLQHEIFVVLDGEFVLLVDQIVILPQLELELVDEDFDLLLGNFDSLLRFVALLQQLLQKLFRLEFYDGGYLKEGHAGLSRTVVGCQCDDGPKRNAVGVEIEVVFLAETGDVHNCTEMQMGV